uniref:NADH-ubiquinone oxidoreductase chain 4 n=1 Tax=Ariosoma shiroanago TaxID=135220 RepID=D1YU31_ARISH|nr:NADH dehydrogenase subunit 4 [Ariosoma shiroanago]BAI53415.1 NADH dehydrogenase subunit 4 [Ariosoma shiroanago]
MLKVLTPTIMLIPLVWTVKEKWLWITTACQSLGIAVIALLWFKWDSETGWTTSNLYLATDPISTPLMVLTTWLLPLMILASQNHMATQPINRQRLYITLLVSLQILLNMAFGATEVILFYVMFEATLIPTLIIITRWGNQTERLDAGTYFLFYTLVGSLPLLLALLLLQKDLGTLSMLTLQFTNPISLQCTGDKIWWVACLMAFLVKIPLYGVHLWLPKAHVEAPVAGSMVLAAVLLKLGGYGIIRVISILSPLTKEMAYPFIVLALWGMIMTSSTCMRQTDLKAIIAYSSVSHMGIVVAGIMIQTSWGLTGAMILMIAHGLVSSSLFCLANFNYERTQSRTLLLVRGLQAIMPLMASWWFIASLANMAFPPLPTLMAEITLISTLLEWSFWSIILTGLGTLITAMYSLYMFLVVKRGITPKHMNTMDPPQTRENLLFLLHLSPILLLMFKPEMISGWC